MRGGTLDIESYPGTWRTFANNIYEAKLMREEKPIMPASFSFKPWGKGKVITRGVWQYDTPRAFMEELWKVFDRNDFLIGHNVKRFDNTQSNTFFAQFGLPAPSKCEFFDTMLIARKNFRLPSYSLKYCVRFFQLGAKLETGGEELWFACEEGDPKARAKMLRYNQNDTIVTDKLFRWQVEQGWSPPPGARYFIPGGPCLRCKVEGMENMQSRGDHPRSGGWVHQYLCKVCGKRNNTEPFKQYKKSSPGEGLVVGVGAS